MGYRFGIFDYATGSLGGAARTSEVSRMSMSWKIRNARVQCSRARGGCRGRDAPGPHRCAPLPG